MDMLCGKKIEIFTTGLKTYSKLAIPLYDDKYASTLRSYSYHYSTLYSNYLGVIAHSELILWPISPALKANVFYMPFPPIPGASPWFTKKNGQCLTIRKVEWNVVQLLWYCHIDINN